jgi:bifunctional non-homologous end joining protein LigD
MAADPTNPNGYRLTVRRDGDMVRLFTRRGYDWSDRYPAIAKAAAKLRAKSFTIDGESAVCGSDGVAVFDALHQEAPRGRSSQLGRTSAPTVCDMT